MMDEREYRSLQRPMHSPLRITPPPRLSPSERISETLRIIHLQPGVTARQIGAATGEAPDRYGVITLYYRMILGLIKDGLVRRDSGNGHHLTEEGKRYYMEIRNGSRKVHSALTYLHGRSTRAAAAPASLAVCRPKQEESKESRGDRSADRREVEPIDRPIPEKGRLKKRRVDLGNQVEMETAVLEILDRAGDRDVIEIARSVGDGSSGQVAVRQAAFALLRRKLIVQLPNPKGGEKRLSVLDLGRKELDFRTSQPLEPQSPPAPPTPDHASRCEEPQEQSVLRMWNIATLRRPVPRPMPPAKPMERFLPDRWTFPEELGVVPNELLEITSTMMDRGDLLRHGPTGALKLEKAHIASIYFFREGRLRDRWQGVMDGRMTAGRISNIGWRKERGIKNALDEAVIEGYLVLEDDLYAPISLVSPLPDGFDRKWVMPSKFLELDESIQHELDKSGIRFIGDVIRIEPLDLETHPRLPTGTCAIVRKALNAYGLDFQDDVPRTTSMACLHRNFDLLKDRGLAS